MPQETGSELAPKPKTKKEAATMQGPVGPQSPGSIGWSNSVLRTDTDQHKIPSPSCIHDREERLAAQSRCRVVREGFQAESSWPWRGKPEQKQPSPAAIDGYNMRLSGVHPATACWECRTTLSNSADWVHINMESPECSAYPSRSPTYNSIQVKHGKTERRQP
jgi:hypothetical protein